MIKTREELLKVTPSWRDIIEYKSLHIWQGWFYLQSQRLTDEEAIEYYNRLHFNKEFIEKL